MALVLLYWLYLFFLTSAVGIGFQYLLKVRKINPYITPILGGFGISLLAGIWALFFNLGIAWDLFITSLGFIIILGRRTETRRYFFSLKAKIASLTIFYKIILVLIVVFAIAQCASAPYILDNESYYIQTIKWLDTYGYVPGLANFHFFLGQNSGWHILQSATNWDGLTSLLNDINGFYLVIVNLYALDKLGQYTTSKVSLHLAAGLFPVFNVFFFQFISAPSPDLGIYILTLIVFIEFAMYYLKARTEKTPVTVIFLLVVFAVYIKVLALFLLIFPLTLYYKNRGLLKKDIFKIGIPSLVALGVFLTKNAIISGYPLYPLAYFKLSTDWVMPLELQHYLIDATKLYAFFVTPEEWEQLSFVQKIVRWLSLPKLHGLFNKAIVLLLVIFPFALKKSTFNKPYTTLYVVTIIQLVVLWLSSPQYRFFFGFLAVMSCVIASLLIKKDIIIKMGLLAATIVIAIPLFIPFDLKVATNNQFEQNLSSFSLDYLVIPHPQTKYNQATYKKNTFENLTYYTPTNIDFFWATGDCELPCIQQQQLDGFKDYFEQAPQMRSSDLKDGFKSVYFPYE